ncbi:unnamed protein product, partial [marine sediment metagenome]
DTCGSITDKQDSYGITISNDYVGGHINDSSIYSAISYSSWNHVVLTSNTTEKRLYLNGVLSESSTSTGIVLNNNNLSIGNKFQGSIDEVMVFNKALSTAEVTSLYNNQSTRFYTTGEMLFEQAFGTSNRLDISIDNCVTPNSTTLQAKTSSGTYTNFVDCSLTDYVISGDNVIIRFNPDSNRFFTPLILGNVTFTSSYVAPAEAETQQSGGGTSITSSTPSETIFV